MREKEFPFSPLMLTFGHYTFAYNKCNFELSWEWVAFFIPLVFAAAKILP